MAKRRHSAADEILLVPFLDILCSLIGVLVLIIVVLCVAESQQTNGRTPEEIQRAEDYKAMLKQQKEDAQLTSVVKAKLATLDKLKEELAAKEQRLAKLRSLLSSSSEMQKSNRSLSQDLLKQLDNLMTEIAGFKSQETELNKTLAALTEELKKRQIPPGKQVAPVIVQPGGSGLARGSKLYFVETSGTRIILFWDAVRKTQVSSAAAVIVADTAYEHFLKEAKKDPGAKLVYLIREDGQGAYNNAAGWAMSTYEFTPAQVARLPIPGRGSIDLQMFKDYLGTLPPPPEAKLMP
ncbi:MAG: hypothetical protein JWO94_2380 [Verrucomicrobiaceae bacterium]|nr:hypothetical protein [Verrucomicrobiaceae bacterium]